MALVPFSAAAAADAAALVELGCDGGGAVEIPAEKLAAMVAAQRELFHGQVEQLERLVVAQCRLTGVNPLAQEMAAGALSIKIGKKPRDLLNPKAVKYMQSLFAVKDTIGKKETREISALCGATVTQVREFFASQRSRVRKLVRLSREKATRIEASKPCDNVCSISSEASQSINKGAPVNVIGPSTIGEPAEVPQYLGTPKAPTDIIHPGDAKTTQDAVQNETMQLEVVPGVESEDKKFLDSIFTLMRKEETFSGQVKLMEWILQINNVAVLSWFLTMGGLTILATWLNQAAIEEQTSVLLVIFKVLLHLPLHKGLPIHMSAVLQTINRLRFYRTSDISNRARYLLSRLSKALVRSQVLKKPLIGSSKGTQKELICKQRISEFLRDESWKSELEIPEEILALTESTNDSRKPEPKRALTLLPASCDEPSKKNCPPTKSKERRKVLLVEQPNRKGVGRNIQIARSVSTNNSRPLSADDIQKAKMRAMFMRDKYGKPDTSKSGEKPETVENQKPFPLLNQSALAASRIPHQPNSKTSVDRILSVPKQSIIPHKSGVLVNSKPNSTFREHLIEKLESMKIRWHTPPEVRIDPSWSVGTGENSKEFEVQVQRNRREKETFYSSLQDIPPNPKDPWDVEMDFDDSLSPEIPIDQPPDADAMEVDSAAASADTAVSVEDKQDSATPSVAPAVVDGDGADGATTEPDLELLAVLLKNPELVFALTSGQGQSLPSEQTVALLDMLKQSDVGEAELANGLANVAKENSKEPEPQPEDIPVSLPSPTPPSDPAARASWRSEFPTLTRAPMLQPHVSGTQAATHIANTVRQDFSVAVTSAMPSHSYASVSGLAAQVPNTILSTVTLDPPIRQHFPSHNPIPSRAAGQQIAAHNAVLPSMRQTISNHAMAPEPKAFPSTSWPSSAANVAVAVRRDTAPDPWAGRPNNSLDVPTNSLSFPNQNAYNAYNSGSVPARSILPGQGLGRNGFVDRPEFETRSREGSHLILRSQELSSDWSYGGQRIDDGRNYSPEPSRQWNSGYRDYHRPNDDHRSCDQYRGYDRYRRR